MATTNDNQPDPVDWPADTADATPDLNDPSGQTDETTFTSSVTIDLKLPTTTSDEDADRIIARFHQLVQVHSATIATTLIAVDGHDDAKIEVRT